MQSHMQVDHATSTIMAWSTHSANVDPSLEEEAGELDEPPDFDATIRSNSNRFKRAPVRRGSEQCESLLTRALQSHSEEDDHSEVHSTFRDRRRSMASNISVASTAEYTCDTGVTTPARTSSPSPRMTDYGFKPISYGGKTPLVRNAPSQTATDKGPVAEVPVKKRCISFACVAKPQNDSKATMPPPPAPSTKPRTDAAKPAETGAPKRPTIKFACPSRPSSTRTTPPQHIEFALEAKPSTSQKSSSPATVVDTRSPSAIRRIRSSSSRRSSRSPAAVRTSKKFLTANAQDLQGESSRFHAFASEGLEEDDWIRREELGSKKLTIDACLEKENAIRRLGEQAEQEAEFEEDEDDEDDEGDAEDEDDEDDVSGDEEDDLDEVEADIDDEEQDGGALYAEESNEEGGSDGYNTDNEVGFADSEEEDDDLVLWTTVGVNQLTITGVTPVRRRSSFVGEIMSDSSVHGGKTIPRRGRRAVPRPPTPELPDSTDFVCGTLDEDRPLEEAYMTRLAERRLEKLHPIPQDIDPSFPTSEPEDDADEIIEDGDDGSDDNLWIHGDMEDIHHEKGRKDRRHGKKKGHVSPKRYHSPPPKRHHSPPPKRHHSPAPKARGRSPRQLFGHSPRRLRSPPPPQVCSSPTASPVLAGQGIGFKPLASRPGLVFTKSLPRPSAQFGPMKGKRGRSGTITKGDHVRGAIDIVKGLEEKRQRRKEKFNQKYCTRARKNPAQSKRPAPGQGAQRMREVGLTMAGKIAGPGNYVLSV